MKDLENPPANRFVGAEPHKEPHDDWFWVYPDDFWF
jgi:hypothetical protein